MPDVERTIRHVQAVVAPYIHELAGAQQTATEVENIMASLAAGRFNSPTEFRAAVQALGRHIERHDAEIRSGLSDEAAARLSEGRAREGLEPAAGYTVMHKNGQSARVPPHLLELARERGWR
jgi:hypothetical protein